MGSPFGLVVDDDPQVRFIFAEVLRNAGIRIMEAGSGAEAMALARLPDLAFVVTDIEMSDGDGLDLCRDLRASITARLPIVVVTGAAFSQADVAKAAGCDVVLEKPCSPMLLVATIKQLLEVATAHPAATNGDGP
ncbi:MAG: response regulator [Vicinamibacteraceae bacterium]